METETERPPATFDEIRAILREVSEAQQRAERLLDKQREEAEQRQKAIDRQMQETDRRINKMQGEFGNQWGELMESLVKGDLIPLLRKRGIQVNQTVGRVPGRYDGKQTEFDIVAMNGEEAVVVEVKTKLRTRDVTRHLKRLAWFTRYVPYHRGHTIYGAVAFLKAHESVQAKAAEHGLFVIRATGSSASILNDDEFRPQTFSEEAGRS